MSATTLPGPLVDAGWLAGAVEDGAVAVADVRWYLDGRSGRDAWAAGHIPGAVWVDIDADLSGPPSPAAGRHPLPTPSALLDRLESLGLVGAPVVAYDDAGGSIAARLWWMLDTLGIDVAVLDGGFGAWPGPLETGAGRAASGAARGDGSSPAAPPAAPAPPAHGWPPGAAVGTPEVDALRRADGVVVLDARSEERYRGGVHPADPRPGHIPGARSAPWSANLDPATGRLLPPEALRARFAALGIGPDTTVVSSCGSGVTACHTLLALRLAGLGGQRRLYPGSWSAWGADPSLPAATGADAG